MKIGTVIAPVASGRRAEYLRGKTLLLAELPGETLGAMDLVGAVPGDRVLLVTGPAARDYCMDAPVDAVAVAVLENAERAAGNAC